MQNPVLIDTMQIGIVVPDLDAAIQRFETDYGIGPWQVHQFRPGEVKEWREPGRIVEGGAKTRFAAAMVGKVQWELIQPLDDTSIFARFLAERGGGVHHIAVGTTNYEELLAAEATRANPLVMECELGGQYEGIKVAYLGTEKTLGVILEVFSGLPGGAGKSAAPALAAETEALREAYAALNRNDVAGFLSIFDPEIERLEFLESPQGGTYRGIEAVTAHVKKARDTWAEGGCEPARFIVSPKGPYAPHGDRIVVLTHVRVRLKHETEWREGRTADVYTFRNGKAVQFRTFADDRQALEWAGVGV
jgi:ketosteroid isomerase-like protein